MKFAAPILALALATLSHSALAIDEGSAAVQAIGRLNGIALACKQPALVSRTRNSVVTTAPKTRAPRAKKAAPAAAASTAQPTGAGSVGLTADVDYRYTTPSTTPSFASHAAVALAS